MWGSFTPSHIVSPSSNYFDIVLPCSWKNARRVQSLLSDDVIRFFTGNKKALRPEPQPPIPPPRLRPFKTPSSCIPQVRHVF